MGAARAVLESLLRERKLDVTLTSERPWAPADEAAPTGLTAIDAVLRGGFRRGHLSEIVGPRSSGRATVLAATLAAATQRGEAVAVIDTCDRFDPAAANAVGVDLSRLLWVRERGDAARALKAMNLVLQAGGFGVVAFDLADVPPLAIRQFPYTTWMRIARVIEGRQTAALIVANDRIARSPGGTSLVLDRAAARWTGVTNRARVLQPVHVSTSSTSHASTSSTSHVSTSSTSHVSTSARGTSHVARRT